MQAWDKFFEVKHAQSEEVQELLNKLLQDLQSINEELAEYINTPSWNLPTSSYDDDDDEYSFATQEYFMTCSTAITPDSPKMGLFIMVDKHLDTILEMESDKFIKSSVENLVQNPRESEDECECHVPDGNDSQTKKISTFSNPLFDDSTSSDDEPRFHSKNDRFDTEYYLLESLLNRDTLMASSPKIDSLLDEFAGELITIPPRIVNREHEEYIILMERLLYDNSSPRPPKDFHANPNTIIESLPTFPIPVEDSDDNSTSLPEFESFHVDYPDSGDSTIDVVDDIPVDDFNPPLSDHELPFHIEIPGSETLLSFSSKNEEKVFNPGILISKGVHSLLPELSHRDFKAFIVINIFESPMEIFPCSYREDIRVLDVPCLNFYPP
ncbi:hypothetical protein Tco_1320219 [Tanacetum coccineum]